MENGKLPTVLICGRGRAGKDSAAHFLSLVTPLPYHGSSSWVGLPVVAQALNLPLEEAWRTRHQRRREWFRILNEYRKDDPSRLIREALARGPLVVGPRSGIEVETARKEGLLDHVIWIENPRAPYDPTMEFGPELADQVVYNNGEWIDFYLALIWWLVLHAKGIPVTTTMSSSSRGPLPWETAFGKS